MSTCNGCGAPMVWAMTTTGRRIPLDAAASDQGPVPLEVEDGNLAPTGRTVDTRHGPTVEVEYVRAGAGVHRTHFATCPKADEFRRNR